MVRSKDSKKLNEKQRRFALEFIIDLNATQAALRSGYSAKTAYSLGQRLLKNVEVKKVVDELTKERSERTKIDSDWVLTELKKNYDVSMADFLTIPEGGGQPYIDLSKATPEQLAAIDEITIDQIGDLVGKIKIKKAPRLKTLDMIGKHVGVQAFREKAEVTHGVTSDLQRLMQEIDGKTLGPPSLRQQIGPITNG